MSETPLNPPAFDSNRCAELLRTWLNRQASADAVEWLEQRIEKISEGEQRTLFLSFGMAPRKVGKDDLQLTKDDVQQAEAARPGWRPNGWTLDQTARTLLLLSYPSTDQERFIETLDQLFAAGEVGELVAMYQAIPVLPHPNVHVLRAAEGMRTNIPAVFRSIAHSNPYPSEHLEEGRWNQMVLKALFIDLQLDPIVGLDQRANATLMRMLIDYAHERWAAGRVVSPELWRCVGPFANDTAIADLTRVLDKGQPLEQQAAALALSQSSKPAATEALRKHPNLDRQVRDGKITWSDIASEMNSTS